MHTARMWQKKSQHEEKNMHIIKRTVKIHAWQIVSLVLYLHAATVAGSPIEVPATLANLHMKYCICMYVSGMNTSQSP
jgi:hypothetical protein